MSETMIGVSQVEYDEATTLLQNARYIVGFSSTSKKTCSKMHPNLVVLNKVYIKYPITSVFE